MYSFHGVQNVVGVHRIPTTTKEKCTKASVS